MALLDEIMARKRTEVADRKIDLSPTELRERPLFSAPRRSLAYAVGLPGSTGIVAGFRRKSPVRGAFVHELFTPGGIAPAYDSFGAAGIAVYTDNHYFGGSLQDLADIRALVQTPLLCHDYIFDSYQLLEAKAYGADAVVLIAAVLSPVQVQELVAEAASLELEVLLEVRNESELGHICAETGLVGICRHAGHRGGEDAGAAESLLKAIPAGKLKIADGFVQHAEDALRLRAAGFDGFIAGDIFMKEPDPAGAFAEFAGALKKQP